MVHTSYSFFLYLLKFGYDSEDLFIFTHIFPRDISKNVEHIQMPKVMFIDGPKMAPLNSIKGIFENIAGYFRYFYGYLKLRLILFLKKRKYDLEAYGHAQTPFSFIFYENDESFIIEDGCLNYVPDILETHKINPIIDKMLHICGIYFLNQKEALGSHKNIKKVYLTNENDNPLIKDKVEVMDIQKLWNEKTEKEKEEILEIFNIDPNIVSNFNDETVLILTQPLSEDRLISYNQEMEIYENILNHFSSSDIILKPHPREKKDYSKIFPNVKVIENSFPIELLGLIGIKPKTVASIVSTAILNFKDAEQYIYDGELYSERLNETRENLTELLNSQ